MPTNQWNLIGSQKAKSNISGWEGVAIFIGSPPKIATTLTELKRKTQKFRLERIFDASFIGSSPPSKDNNEIDRNQRKSLESSLRTVSCCKFHWIFAPPKTAVELIEIRENLKIFASSGLFVKLPLDLQPPSRGGGAEGRLSNAGKWKSWGVSQKYWEVVQKISTFSPATALWS